MAVLGKNVAAKVSVRHLGITTWYGWLAEQRRVEREKVTGIGTQAASSVEHCPFLLHNNVILQGKGGPIIMRPPVMQK